MNKITLPFQFATDRSGLAINGGKIFVGIAGHDPETHPIAIYSDYLLTISASQPVSTIAGFPVSNGTPINIFCAEDDYSIKIKDKNNVTIYTSLNVNPASATYTNTQIINDIATLRTIAPRNTKRVVQIKYHTSDASGGGGFFREVYGAAPGTYTHNNGSIVVPSGGDGSAAWLRLSETYDVREFGAIADGATNDTSCTQAAVTAWPKVYFSPGTYLLDTITLASDKQLYGDGDVSIIKQNNITANSYGTFFADSGSNVSYISRLRIRDLKFLGNVVAAGFSEYKHLISLNGVSNVDIERVTLYGFQGDGIYIGSGTVAGNERHNKFVTIRKCLFDGVTRENRNGISIIDGDEILIDDNEFYRCTKSTMPAAIDIEPDGYAFHIMRNITVKNNRFDTVRSGILFTNLDNLTEPIFGITIENNIVKSAENIGIATLFSFTTTPLTQSVRNMGIRVIGNRVESSGIPYSLSAVKGAEIRGNTFVDCTASVVLGDGSFSRVLSYDVVFSDNTIERCGTAGTTWISGLKVNGITNVTIDNNTFIDCGDNIASSGCGVLFAPSSPSAANGIKFRGNKFYKVGLANMDATRLITSTISYSYDDIYSNEFNSLVSIFLGDSGTFTPTISFSTPGDLAVAYSTQFGRWSRKGKLVTLLYNIVTSSFTYTTSSGVMTFSGIPAANISTDSYNPIGIYQGITKAAHTQFALQIRASSSVGWIQSGGSGQAISNVTTSHIPSASSVVLSGSAEYFIQ